MRQALKGVGPTHSPWKGDRGGTNTHFQVGLPSQSTHHWVLPCLLSLERRTSSKSQCTQHRSAPEEAPQKTDETTQTLRVYLSGYAAGHHHATFTLKQLSLDGGGQDALSLKGHSTYRPTGGRTLERWNQAPVNILPARGETQTFTFSRSGSAHAMFWVGIDGEPLLPAPYMYS